MKELSPEDSDETTITKKELRETVARWMHSIAGDPFGYRDPELLARAIVQNVYDNRIQETIGKRVNPTTPVITEAALRQALRAAGFAEGGKWIIPVKPGHTPLSYITADQAAAHIMQIANEPSFAHGDLARDLDGTVWRRSGAGWVKFGSGHVYRTEEPRRPLTAVMLVDDPGE